MGVDMFICGSCQWVFHSIEEFMLHKNSLCGQNNDSKKQVAKTEACDGSETNMQQLESYQVVENSEMTVEEKSPISIQANTSIVKEDVLTTDQMVKHEDVGSHISQVQTSNQDDQNGTPFPEVIQHHILQLQDGTQQVQIANVVGENIELAAILNALQQGQAIAVQEGSVLPTEIQVVVSAKPGAELTQVTTEESQPVPKPAKRRGRPRKGEEKNKQTQKVLDDQEKQKIPQKDASGMLTCGRCKKKFSKERHFNTHKCLAMSDFVDIMEKELISMDDESDSDDNEEMKDVDFRAPAIHKKYKTLQTVTNQQQEMQSDENAEKKGDEAKVSNKVEYTEGQGSKSLLASSVDDVSDLTKEGLADFPGAGDVKLSQVRVEDGIEEPKLPDSLTAELESHSRDVYKSRRGRKPKGTSIEQAVTRQNIKDLPIFKNEEDRLDFEKCTNIDLSEVDHLFKQHIIDQEINKNAPPLKNRASDKLSVFSCNVCEKIIMTKSHARLHCVTHTDLKPFKCFKCQFATNTKGNLYSHMRKHTGQLYRCSVCSFSTINKGHLIEHEAVHSSNRYECKICHNDYSTIKSLYGHVKRKHGSSKKGKEYINSFNRGRSRGQAVLHQCHICNRKFKKKIDRDRHMYMHNIKDNPNVFSCDLCNRTCSRRAYLEKHLIRHRIIYFCSDCDHKFPSTVHLTQHLIDAHLSGENVMEEVLKEKFEKCIETSIYLPEPDGSMNFEEEVEEGDSGLFGAEGEESGKSDKSLIQEEQPLKETDEDMDELVLPCEKTGYIQMVENDGLDKKAEEQLATENGQRAHGESVIIEGSEACSLSEKIQPKQDSCPDGICEESPDAKQMEANENDSSRNEMDATATSSSELVQDNGVNVGTGAQVENGAALPKGDKENDYDDAEESADGSQPVYNKEFFKRMGFKLLNVNKYNQIRQVFGREECEFCGRLYFSAADFEHHLRTHTGERPFGCNQCSYKAISKENLRRHIEKEHDKVKFVCNKCNFVASNRSQLWSHIQGHKKQESYSCPSCGRTFTQPKTLKIHMSITHPDLPEGEIKMATSTAPKARAKIGRKCYRCPQCDRGLFRNAADLQKHIWIHEGIKPFKCPLCPHACRSRNNLASHMIRHSLDKPFLCTECGRAYKSKTALRWHVKSHKDGKFKCQKCPYEATQMSHLKRHMETHDVLKRYVCQQCSYSSNTLGYLKIHYARHHKGHQFTQSNTVTNHVPVVGATPDPATKTYRCLSCDYLFGNLSDMKRHLKLRHHIQLDNVSLLEDLTVSNIVGDDSLTRVFPVDSTNTITAMENSQPDPEQGLTAPEVQVVQLTDQLGVTMDTIATDDDNTSVQPLQYSVSGGENEDKIQSAVNILQHIIDISRQGNLGPQEITVKSQDGQSFIVRQQDETNAIKQDSGQYVIQYVMSDGLEVTVGEQNTQHTINESEVITQGEELSEKVKVQNMAELHVGVQAEGIDGITMEQTSEVLQSEVLDFNGHGSAVPSNVVAMSNMAVEMTSEPDGIKNDMTSVLITSRDNLTAIS